MSGANASPIGRSDKEDERSEGKPDAKRERDSAKHKAQGAAIET
jgi:hypothetical protein